MKKCSRLVMLLSLVAFNLHADQKDQMKESVPSSVTVKAVLESQRISVGDLASFPESFWPEGTFIDATGALRLNTQERAVQKNGSPVVSYVLKTIRPTQVIEGAAGSLEISGQGGRIQFSLTSGGGLKTVIEPPVGLEDDFYPISFTHPDSTNVAISAATPATCSCDNTAGSGCTQEKCEDLTTCTGCTGCSCALTSYEPARATLRFRQ